MFPPRRSRSDKTALVENDGASCRVRAATWFGLVVVAMAAALYVGWIGFMASDDSLYHAGAVRWLVDPPFAGSDHWSTRFPLTLTFAAVIAVVGNNFAAFAVTAMLFYVLLVVVVGGFAAAVGSPRAGWIAALLTATLPVVVSHATTVSVDLIEAAALVVGAWLLGSSREDPGGLLRAGLGGVMFGTAVLCRETSVLPLMVLGPLFLIGRPLPRRVLMACGIGAAMVLVGEALFQYALTGDPLRRYAIAFHHDEHINRAANHEGNFLLWAPIDPLLVLLINDDFGLLFWIAGIACVGRCWTRLPVARRAPFLLLAAMAGSSFILVSALYAKLVLNPRYFMLAALAAVILVALWLDRIRAWARIMVLAVLVSTNLLLVSVGNAHPRWPMEALLIAAEAHPQAVVAGAPNDVARSDIPMAFLRQTNIRPLPAQPGDLVVAPATHAPKGVVIARYPSPPTRLGALLRWLGLEPLVPSAISRRMFAPSPEMVLVRPQGG
ncbi:glycosyltransferase family 39 protein [Sphingomonas sp. IC4-52]|uniref:glycosyltransferase family 39 protein n=1 Tax=Sphingomonas sp. IC4-52 TaxID=2887202 RepID=UPI001D121EDB|nr:glycosyltransferase family 39 protein [Sphingomonas sp. IC4-52]MCC2978842.1 glycosyltransferase family 39 protein [Sphingomonas sp. IC4-52]